MKKTLLILAGYSRTGATSLFRTYLHQPFEPIPFKGIDNIKEPRFISGEMGIRKNFEQYMKDYADFLEDHPGKIGVDFSPFEKMFLSPEDIDLLYQLSQEVGLDIKVLMSLRHPVDRWESVYCKNVDKCIRDNLPIDLDPYRFLGVGSAHVKYQETYDKFSRKFPVFVIDGIHYHKTRYRQKEFSEFLDYDLPDVPEVHVNAPRRLKEKIHRGYIKKNWVEPEEGPKVRGLFKYDHVPQGAIYGVDVEIKNLWNALVAAEYRIKNKEDIEAWERLCY